MAASSITTSKIVTHGLFGAYVAIDTSAIFATCRDPLATAAKATIVISAACLIITFATPDTTPKT